MNRFRLLLVLATCLVSGCSCLSYYSQAVSGHVEVMLASRPIAEVIEDPACTPELRQKLEEVRAIRDFASRELGLPDNNSYRSYADLRRPYVTWNVFAVPEFSLHMQTWCMPFVGCVGYRGFYNKDDADALAKELKSQGFDTYVGGVPAYSTLGYFSDPVLNTFLKSNSIDMARLIFHELAHQVLYVEGDTVFNESFATAVENEGLRKWLAARNDPGLWEKVTGHYEQKSAFVDFVSGYRAKLKAIYSSGLPVAQKREAKESVLSEMKENYLAAQEAAGQPPVYKYWLDKDLNNAKLASLALYTQWLPAFETILEEEGRDLPKFYARVSELAQMPTAERNVALRRMQGLQTAKTLEVAASSPGH